MLQVCVGSPPVAVRVAEYATFTAPFGSVFVVMVSTGTETRTEYCAEVVPWLAVDATMTNDDVPTVLGVPLRTPVEELNTRPGGKEPELSAKVTGGVPPVVVIAAL
jgi:hypothetical protein